MADDPQIMAEIREPSGSPNEDAETKATREELKHTVISDESGNAPAVPKDTDREMDKDGGENVAGFAREATPDRADLTDASDALKEQVSSPKKKRAHDELDEHKDPSEPVFADNATTTESNSGAAVSRTHRSEPEKKRPRDELGQDVKKTVTVDLHASPAAEKGKASTEPASAVTEEDRPAATDASKSEGDSATVKSKAVPPSTSASAFASSGFSKLAGTTSPFGALGSTGSTKLGSFGGSISSSPSPFGALVAGSKSTGSSFGATPTLSLGKDAKSDTASPFAALNGTASKPFGGTFGGGFGSGFSGGFGAPKLTSFAKPGGDLNKSDKPAKPFGAPDSGNEESSGGEDDDGDEDDEAEDSGPEEPENEEKESDEPKRAPAADDKKKPKLQKVVVDDGESGESSVFMGRAKVYQLDKASSTWKERGAGFLKINVPDASIQFDNHRTPLPHTFDASVLSSVDDADDKTPKVARLLMRQDHTHRVVLNTAILAATDFIERETLKSITFIFSAFEGHDAKPSTLQLKMSQPNAKQFIGIIKLIQNELKNLG